MDNQGIEHVRDAKFSTHPETHADKPATEEVENVAVTLTEEDVG